MVEGGATSWSVSMAGVFFARRRNLAIGGLNVAYGVGSFIGPILGTQRFLAASGNWRPPLVVFGLLGLAYLLTKLGFTARAQVATWVASNP